MFENLMKEGNWAVLFGAGVSIDAPALLPSGMALSSELMKNIIHENAYGVIEPYVYSDTTGWNTGKIIRFEQIIELLYESFDSIKFLDFIKDYKEPNSNHYSLANLARKGVILLTTNFDCLLEYAAQNINLEIEQTHFSNSEILKIIPRPNVIYKLHGSVYNIEYGYEIDSSDSIRTTISNIYAQGGWDKENTLSCFLKDILKNYNLIVAGYSGMDDFDISPIIQTTKSDKKLIWIEHKENLNSEYISPLGTLDDEGCKSHRLLQSIASRQVRRLNNILIAQGRTNKILSRLSGFSNDISNDKPHPVSNHGYSDYINSWFKIHSTEKHKLHLTSYLLVKIWEPEVALSLLSSNYSQKNAFFLRDILDEKLLVVYTNAVAQLLIKKPESTNLLDNIYVIEGLIEQFSSRKYKSNICNNIALIYTALNHTEKSCNWLKKAIKYAEKANDLLIPLINIAGLCLPKEDGLHMFENKVLPLAKKYNLIEHYPNIYSGISQILTSLDYDKNKAKAMEYERLIIHYSALVGNYPLFFKTLASIGTSSSDARRYSDILTNETMVDQYLLEHEKIQYYLSLANIFSAYDIGKQILYTKKAVDLMKKLLTSSTYNLKDKNNDVASAILGYADLLRQHRRIDDAIDAASTVEGYIDPEISNDIHLHLNILKAKLSFLKKDTKNNELYYSNFQSELKKKNNVNNNALLVDYFYDIKSYDVAIEIGKKCLFEFGEYEAKHMVLELIGNCYFNKAEYFEAKVWYLEVLSNRHLVPDQEIGAVLFNLARIEEKSKKYLHSIILIELSKLFGGHDKELIININEILIEKHLFSNVVNDVKNYIYILSKERDGVSNYLDVTVNKLKQGHDLEIEYN